MKALIAMSGGVDSSLSAKLMIDKGYECIGCNMRLYERDEEDEAGSKTCCSLDDVTDAREVAHRLGMPFYVFNFTGDFREKVICPFIESYEKGRTPNPCIDCNRYMKFGKLCDRAKELGCDKIVTGHYARIVFENGEYKLKKALDPDKDQSYVLWFLSQEQLAHTVFPLGEYKKSEVRKIAAECGFVNADKPDSQDICFVPDGDYAKIIKDYTGREYPPGDYTDLEGKVIGRHRGILHYTVGQRKGLGQAFLEPRYVCAIDPEKNTVTLGKNEDLFKREVKVAGFHWISGKAPERAIRCGAKIRYRQSEKSAKVTPIGEDLVLIEFDEPQRAITPGQSAVLYDGDVVLGGGIIVREF